MNQNLENTSFMQALCVGRIEEELIFPYPKMKPEEQATLQTLAATLKQWLGGKEHEFQKWDLEGKMPPEFLQEMREMGLFGLIIPEEFGGFGFSAQAYSRAIQELSKYDGSIAITAGCHSSIGMRGLYLYGTDEQKKKYYPKLATGEMIAAFCLTEANAGSDAASLRTKAVSDGKGGWLITGEKIWITNGGIGDFFTVFAKTDGATEKELGKVTAFIVTRDMKGLSTGPKEDKMGIRASSTVTVTLDQVRVGPEHVIGEVGKGFKVAMNILNSGRTGLGGGSVGGMKRMIALATVQAKGRKQFDQPLANYGLIKQKIGRMMVNCYVSESIVNMVAGLVDRKFKDFAVEAAISKVFATESLWDTVDEALQIAGGMGFMREAPYEKAMRDCRINRIFEGTNEILRLFIALSAMHEAGEELKEVAGSLSTVLSDPIKGFGVISDYAKRRVTQVTGIGKSQMTKHNPALKDFAKLFDEVTLRLSSAADQIIRKHGKNIVHKQFATRRLADIMIDVFALACTISRVSQSIEEKGLAKAGKEIEMLEIFANLAKKRIDGNFNSIDHNNDEIVKSVADFAFDQEKFIFDNI